MKFFQSLFPPLSPKTLSLSSARRVVLIAWNAERGTLDFRHYLITVRPYGVSRRVRKVLEGVTKSSILDLGKEQDVADYVLRKRGEEGYETASTSAASEADADEVTVKLAGDYAGRNNRKGEKRAVKLDEIGPRMELRLVKITEGVPGKEGGVIFHEFSAFLFSSFDGLDELVLTTQNLDSQEISGRDCRAESRCRSKTQAQAGATRRTRAQRCPEKACRRRQDWGGHGRRRGRRS